MNAASMKRIPTLAILLMMSMIWACDGDDGAVGPAGPQGPPGQDGDPAPVPDPVTAAIEKAQPESCTTCHSGVGYGEHQSVYDKYTDESRLTLTFDDLASVDNLNGTYTVTLTYTVEKDGQPVLNNLDTDGDPTFGEIRFEAVTYDDATRQYLNECRLRQNWTEIGGGQYTVQDTDCSYAPELQTGAGQGAHLYGYVADGSLFEHVGGTGSEISTDTHVHIYDDLASAALAYGTADSASGTAYKSLANVTGCETCHGKPYLKHGFRDPIVANLPDFASCKSCHYDNRGGGHEDWQYMVDDPANWAVAGLDTAIVEDKYGYTANLMNDTHMAHAMEFPYPQSMSNCATCHDGNLTQILDNSYFAAETCKSCHPVEGLGAWPEFEGIEAGPYNQPHRAPPLTYLWAAADAEFHDISMTCTNCHGDPGVPTALPFGQLHSGYDSDTYDDTGGRFADMYTVSIDSITRDGDELTIQYSSNDPTMSYWLAVSFYGWDSKHFIVPSHERAADSGPRFEYIPPNANPLFAETANSEPGAWEVVVDMAGWVGNPDSVVNLIAANEIRRAEVSVIPTIMIDGESKKLNAVSTTFDLVADAVDPDWFKLDNAIVDVGKCNVCHDRLNFHDSFGLGIGGKTGDRLVCVNCHNPTFAGSHLEMASRSIENYVHSIHSFQNFDVGDVFGSNGYDPVDTLRYDQHIKHVFPNFTIRNCEACHLPGTYEVPDQTQSLPGLQAASDSPTTWYKMVSSGGNIPRNIPQEVATGRNIGTVAEAVTGPASRACGACHRARLINQDEAGALASFNAHVGTFGTYVDDNPPEDTGDEVLFGIIDKLMTWFE